MSRLLAPGGCQAILSRSLHVARAEFAFLDGVRAGKAPETCLAGLDERLLPIEPARAHAALVAVLSTVLDLLVGFIGEDLTTRLVRQVWADLPFPEPSSPANA